VKSAEGEAGDGRKRHVREPECALARNEEAGNEEDADLSHGCDVAREAVHAINVLATLHHRHCLRGICALLSTQITVVETDKPPVNLAVERSVSTLAELLLLAFELSTATHRGV
jgi:hypothetical protein